VKRAALHYLDHVLLGVVIFAAGYLWARLHAHHHGEVK